MSYFVNRKRIIYTDDRMIEGITFIEKFIENPETLFTHLQGIAWDERMQARKTASFGIAYNYSQISYPETPLPNELQDVIQKMSAIVGFEPNNCLINYYLDGKSKMGFHSDQTDILFENTGIGIVSLGAERILRFRNIANPEIIIDFVLPSGSLIYMTQKVQSKWVHAIPKSDTDQGRMSLTFRKIKD